MLTTDFHTHILPGIDDGSPNAAESVKMIQQEIEQGVETVFLTPHFCAKEQYPDEFLDKRNVSYKSLIDALAEENKQPKFLLGAEVEYSAGMSQWTQLNLLSMDKTGYLLLEMPVGTWNEEIYRELELIYTERGITPILAHIERYVGFWNMNRILNRLADLPVLLQVNCSFINDKRSRRTALRLINEHRIHLIGSDCHSSQWRCPCMAETRELLDVNTSQEAQSFLSMTEDAIINGEDLIVVNSSLQY